MPSFGRSRSIRGYRRIHGHKPPGKVVAIVCEGRETEPKYFCALRQKFRLSTLNIRIIPGKGAPISVVNSAIDEKKKQEADEVWGVLDTECLSENPSLNAAIAKARKAKVNLAISNPSFEYWYFIHFDTSSRPFSSGQEMKKALRTYISNYEESTDVFTILDGLTSQAIKNAEILRQRSYESWDTFPNPSTSVDKLVQEIIEMGKAMRSDRDQR
jgi:hypothetical protein